MWPVRAGGWQGVSIVDARPPIYDCEEQAEVEISTRHPIFSTAGFAELGTIVFVRFDRNYWSVKSQFSQLLLDCKIGSKAIPCPPDNLGLEILYKKD